MADTTPTTSEASTPPSSAAEQARIRKERREAKIRAGGSSRLNKITGLGGGVQREAPPQPTATEHDDPAEVDISNHYYKPAQSSRPSQPSTPMNDEALRQMMLGFDPSQNPNPDADGTPRTAANPFAGFSAVGDPRMEADDPVMKMMQQMMGSMGGQGAGGMPAFPSMPGQPRDAASSDRYAYLWRLIHALFALCLGFYIALSTPFSGARIARETPSYTSISTESFIPERVHFFWIFATMEVLLQSSRFFLEKGHVQPGGILGMVVGFLPEPWKGYVLMVSRYGRIWTTVSGDAMVCVFVLGVCAWWRGA